MRRLLGAVVAVAFLMASAGIGHIMPTSSPHDHPVETASPHAGECYTGIALAKDCTDTTAQQDRGQPAKHGAFGSCCIVACSPTIAAAASTDFSVLNWSSVRLDVHVEQFADSNVPDGLFRPPRARA